MDEDTVARVGILGVDVDVVTLEGALQRIESLWADSGRGHLVITANPELIMAALETPRLRQAFDQSELVVPDGIGVVWASRILGIPLPERVPGIELAELALASCARANRKAYLLGGMPGVAEEAATVLAERYPGLIISGVGDGYFPESQSEDVAEAIAAHQVDLLLAGMGAPKQEMWLARYASQLNARVMMGVGGAFDVFAGRVRRAPIALQKLGLEWVYRFVSDPKRAPRMLALPRFVAAVLWTQWRG